MRQMKSFVVNGLCLAALASASGVASGADAAPEQGRRLGDLVTPRLMGSAQLEGTGAKAVIECSYRGWQQRSADNAGVELGLRVQVTISGMGPFTMYSAHGQVTAYGAHMRCPESSEGNMHSVFPGENEPVLLICGTISGEPEGGWADSSAYIQLSGSEGRVIECSAAP